MVLIGVFRLLITPVIDANLPFSGLGKTGNQPF